LTKPSLLRFLKHEAQRLRLKAGGHFGAGHCQPAIKFISYNTFQIGTIRPLDFSLC